MGRSLRSRARRLAFVACLLAQAAGCGWGEADIPGIRPGQEQLLSEMLGASSELPGNCRWEGGGIEANITSRYRCPGAVEQQVLTLSHPSAPGEEKVRTAQFKVATSAGFPPALLDFLVARIKESESAFVWGGITRSQDVGPRSILERGLARLGFQFRDGASTAVHIVIAVCALAIISLVATRPSRSQARFAAGEAKSPLAISVCILAFALAVFMAARLRFQLDDYLYLVKARTCPFCEDVSFRVVSSNLLFAVGGLIDNWRPFFAICNLLMLGIGAALWVSLLRRLRAAPDEALLAGSLAILAPGAYMLLRFASGFQQLAIYALVFGVLWLVDSAARATDETAAGWRRALLLSACALGMLGTLVKYPVLVVLPASTWIWARWLVPAGVPSLRRPWFHLALGACLALPLLVGLDADPETGELGKLGIHTLRANLQYLGLELLWGWGLGVMAALLALSFLALLFSLSSRDDGSQEARARVSRTAGSVGAGRYLVGMLALTVLWLIPFLLNALYVAAYYLLLPVAPLAAIVALPLHRCAARIRPAWLAAAVALPLLVPYHQLELELRVIPADELATWLDELRMLTADRAAPRTVSILAACDAETDNTRSQNHLRELYRVGEGGAAFRWATGWDETEFTVAAAESDARKQQDGHFVIRYCRGEPTEIAP